jgi:hypothetical protein
VRAFERFSDVWLSWVRVPLLAALTIVGLFATSSPDSAPRAHPLSELRTDLTGLREAVRLYREDHGRAPCQAGDDNRALDPRMFVRQLTCCTNLNGRPGAERDDEYRFGPYLSTWPVQPITRSAALRIVRPTELEPRHVQRGGWFYDPRDGRIGPDLPDDWGAELDEP